MKLHLILCVWHSRLVPSDLRRPCDLYSGVGIVTLGLGIQGWESFRLSATEESKERSGNNGVWRLIIRAAQLVFYEGKTEQRNNQSPSVNGNCLIYDPL